MKINPLFFLIFIFIWMCAAFAQPVHAEEPVPDSVPGAVLVNDTELYSKLDVLQQTLDSISAALAEDEPATPETAPDYSAQLQVIADELQQVKENTTPATPDEPLPLFERPFEEYSTTDFLLLIVAVLAFCAAAFGLLNAVTNRR